MRERSGEGRRFSSAPKNRDPFTSNPCGRGLERAAGSLQPPKIETLIIQIMKLNTGINDYQETLSMIKIYMKVGYRFENSKS